MDDSRQALLRWLCLGLLVPLLGIGLPGCSLLPYRSARNLSICPPGTGPTSAPFLPGAREVVCVANGAPAVKPEVRPVPRARQSFVETDTDVPDVFVGLAISGGGSRAAAFGLAVMEQLDELGLLAHVSAISTTSGGGLAGAYYATRGPAIRWDEGKQAMGTNFLGRWILRNLLPHNLLSTTFTHEDRSDLMADVFDAALFDGVTFGDLGPFEVGSRPIWLANATDAGRGLRFTFSDEQLRQMHSSLASLPISQAVMASAAFPGAFNSVTLRQYLPVRQQPDGSLAEPLVAYTHLLDGGPTDNLGLEALLQLAASHQRATVGRRTQARPDRRCLLIVADAYPSGVPSRKLWDPEPRAWYDHLADLNFLDAFDALLARRRTDILGYAGIREGDRTGRLPAHPFVQFDVPMETGRLAPLGQIRRVGDFTAAEHEARVRGGALFKPVPIPEGHFRCAAWHVNLSGVEAVRRYTVDPDTQLPQPLEGDAAGRHPLMRHRQALHHVVTQIGTNFRLEGPANCSSSFLLDALYGAAFVLVREDHASQTRACSWAQEAGLSVSTACGRFPGNRTLVELPLDGVEPDADRLASGRARDESVRCRP